MPIIDLDHQVQIMPRRPAPPRLPVLIALAGALLFGFTGEPQAPAPASPVDEAADCSSFNVAYGPIQETVVFNSDNAEILRIPHCPA